jgi:hypothetical protein
MADDPLEEAKLGIQLVRRALDNSKDDPHTLALAGWVLATIAHDEAGVCGVHDGQLGTWGATSALAPQHLHITCVSNHFNGTESGNSSTSRMRVVAQARQNTSKERAFLALISPSVSAGSGHLDVRALFMQEC